MRPERDEVYERLLTFVGIGDGAPRRSVGAVSEDRIRDWCEAIGDNNPIYLNADAARAAGYPDIVCPPAMLMVWTMAGLENQKNAIVGPTGLRLRQLLRDAGYTGTLAVNCEQEYVRYLRLGERIVAESVIGDVSARKATALGEGYFHSLRITYRTEAGEVVGKVTFRTLSFRPKVPAHHKKSPTEADPRVPPVVNRDTEFFWDGLNKGELRAQRCDDCNTLRNPPSPMCPACNSLRWSVQRLSGGGSIYSFVVMHHPKLPGFEPPYGVVLADMDEGIRLVAGISSPLDQLAVGRRLKTQFRNVGTFSVADFVLDDGIS